MREIMIDTNEPYRVLIGGGLLRDAGALIQSLERKPGAVAVITDSHVGPLYAERLEESLKDFRHYVYTVDAGEENKTPETLIAILRSMALHEITRADLVVALGGGVVGDMAGFASAVYQRGMRFIQCPTTLLSAVDASVGGKTAVDLPEGKNLIGAFHQPAMVLCDTDTFQTLDPARIADGAAEIVKHAVISDEKLFDVMAAQDWQSDIDAIVARNVEIKRSFVLQDEHDLGQRQMLNFGHTIGHAVEAWSRFRLSHGQAVAVGMVMETRAARRLGMTELAEDALIGILEAKELPTAVEATAEDILEFATRDKKQQSGTVTVVVPDRIGHARLEHLDMGRFRQYVEASLP